MAYRAEIQIGVKGSQDLIQLQKRLEGTLHKINEINKKQVSAFGGIAQSLKNYRQQLDLAAKSLDRVSAGSAQESRAINNYVTALGQSNTARARQNDLIQREILLRERASRIKALPPTTPTTQAYSGPIGPGQAITDPGRIAANQRLARERAAANKRIAQEQARQQKAAIDAQVRQQREVVAARTKRRQDIGLGAGFPALFGGGAGQVIGGAVGGAVGGFAGSIVGSAIAQQIEDATKKVAELGNALKQLNIDKLRDSFITVNAELETTVRQLIRAGDAQSAFEAASREAALQTGLLPEATQDITNNVNVLSNVWDETVGTVSSLLSILSAPFVSALAGILKIVNLVVKGVNVILSETGALLKRITEGIANSLGLQRVLEAIEFIMKATNEEEEKSLATLVERGRQLENELQNNQQLFELEKNRTLGRTAAEKEINAEIDRAKALKRVDLDLEKQIKEKREEFGAAVSHAAQVERDYQIVLLQKAAELEKSKINQNHLLKQQQINLEKIKEKYEDLNEDLKAREVMLEAEVKIYGIQQKSLDSLIELERSRNDLASARLDLEESRLQRQLDQLGDVNASHIVRGQIIDQIAQKQLQQAQIEYKNNIISIEQSVTKAELARKQVDFEVKRLQLQVESLKLQAQSIKDLGLREAALKRIAAQEQSTLNIAREMIAAADQQLATTRQIAENQKIAAGYALQGKIEAIEASAAEQKRAAFLERAAAAQKQVATSAAAASAAGGPVPPKKTSADAKKTSAGGSTTKTVTTSMPIDEAVRKKVLANAPKGGYRSVEELVGKLEEEQRTVNKRRGIEADIKKTTENRPTPPMRGFAEGGYVSAPTMGMVGEGSQPEYIIPEDKMEEAMARYAAGARGASVIPGGSSGISPVVNVTTGPVMNMDGQNYITQNDFVAGLQSASTRGAEMAMQMITSSGGARRRLGVG